MYDDLVEFLQESVTPFHAAATAESWLCAAGFTRLEEADYWNLEPGKGYYTTRNGSSVVAWRVPQHAIGGWRIVASHSDSPSWKIKADTVENDGCRRLSVEGYGGMIMSTWLDRPLTVAGRVMVKTEDGIESRLVYLDRDLLVIPSLAIHFQRDINKGHTFNPQVDMQPLWGPAGSRTLTDLVAESLGVEAADILDSDLQLVTRQAPTQIGPDGEFFMAPRIDDLECAATTLLGFLDASGETDSACAPVWAMFDNEEVGSSSRMGAESSYLRDVLDRILEAVPHSAQASHRAMANSFMLSADNAHATHPNFPQKSDPCAPVRLGGGVVLQQKFGSVSELRAGVNGGAGIALNGSPVTASLPQQQGVTIGGLTIPAPPTDAQISGGGKVDAAYIVATPQEIAFIKPMIAMRNGSQSGATLYASSRSAQGTAGPDFRLEMDGLQYSEIPMLAGSNPALMQQALSAVRNDYSLARLYAMGADAWSLANHFTQMRQTPGFELNGNTGDLTANQDCVINRKLSWLKYQQGKIVPAS